MTRRFYLSTPRVLHESIEGEVIVIDLKTGSYYSLRDSAAAIWHAVERGAGEDEIAAELEQRFDGSGKDIGSAVARLLDQLSAEGLIGEAAADDPAEPAPQVVGGEQPRAAFSTPVLEKHTDMQDLILLDPVHEVDARGWPHAAEVVDPR